MSNTETTAIMQRVRHEFRARHVQLLAREQISPGFIRLTVGGPELQGFVSAGFDDHSKLILPQAGQEKPNLPQIIDGRPHIEGARPEMRDYTPINYDAARNTLQLEFAVHGTGPAVEWARSAPLGQWLGVGSRTIGCLKTSVRCCMAERYCKQFWQHGNPVPRSCHADQPS